MLLLALVMWSARKGREVGNMRVGGESADVMRHPRSMDSYAARNRFGWVSPAYVRALPSAMVSPCGRARSFAARASRARRTQRARRPLVRPCWPRAGRVGPIRVDISSPALHPKKHSLPPALQGFPDSTHNRSSFTHLTHERRRCAQKAVTLGLADIARLGADRVRPGADNAG
jgi:hypothetical protein